MMNPKRRPNLTPEDIVKLREQGERIKEARERKGLSQHGLAMKLGLTAGAVGQWEIGANNPEMGNFDKMAAALGVTVDFLRNGPTGELKDLARDTGERRIQNTMRKLPGAEKQSLLAVSDVYDRLDGTNQRSTVTKAAHILEVLEEESVTTEEKATIHTAMSMLQGGKQTETAAALWEVLQALTSAESDNESPLETAVVLLDALERLAVTDVERRAINAAVGVLHSLSATEAEKKRPPAVRGDPARKMGSRQGRRPGGSVREASL